MGILQNLQSSQHLTARLIVAELLRNKIDTYAVSPGARSIPFITALNENKNIHLKLFNDERSAAFWAQGYSKGAGKPAVLLATSGTAVANYLPGVIEASLSGVPLIIISCDRPWELKYAKANQTISQANIFSEYVKLQIDLPATENCVYPESLLANIDQLAALTKESPAGPVHLNIAFRKPFAEDNYQFENEAEIKIITNWEGALKPFTEISEIRKTPATATHIELCEQLNKSDKVVLVAGPLNKQNNQSILKLAQKIKAPILADINSGLRGQANVYGLYNSWLKQAAPADMILYFGDRIISESLRSYINSAKVSVLITDYPARQDAVENEFIRFHKKFTCTPTEFTEDTLNNVQEKNPNQLCNSFENCEQKAIEKIAALPDFSEARIIATIISGASEAIYLSSSLILREAEYFGIPAKNTFVCCNRGAVGIDGVLSSACGFASGSVKNTFVLIGDQALQHDLTAINFLKNSKVHVFLINNGGGAIFNILPCREIHSILNNAQEIDFSNAAKTYGVNYQKVSSLQELLRRIDSLKSLNYGSLTEVCCLGSDSAALLKSI